jgi:hypothetical protein
LPSCSPVTKLASNRDRKLRALGIAGSQKLQGHFLLENSQTLDGNMTRRLGERCYPQLVDCLQKIAMESQNYHSHAGRRAGLFKNRQLRRRRNASREPLLRNAVLVLARARDREAVTNGNRNLAVDPQLKDGVERWLCRPIANRNVKSPSTCPFQGDIRVTRPCRPRKTDARKAPASWRAAWCPGPGSPPSALTENSGGSSTCCRGPYGARSSSLRGL